MRPTWNRIYPNKMDAVTVTTLQSTSTTTESGQERCRKYNACVLYLVKDPPSQEVREILAVGAGANRRSGLSVGTALVSLDQMYDVTLPRNTIATVTIQDKGGGK